MFLNKFQSVVTTVVDRLMTEAEIKERAAEMKLSEEVTQFIIERFNEGRSQIGMGGDYSGEVTEDDIARGDGALGLESKYEDVMHDLGVVMGKDMNVGSTPDEVINVFCAFFEE